MKLLIVTPYYAPAWAYGGPPKLLSEFAQTMVKRGHKLTVVTTDALNQYPNPKLKEKIGGVTIHRFPNRSNSLAWKQKLFSPIGLSAFLTKNVKDFDFVLTTDWRNVLNIACYKSCSSAKIPYGLAVFGQLPLTKDAKRPIKQLFDRLYGKKILKAAKVLFAQTSHEAKEYEKIIGPNQKIIFWPLAIDLAPFKKLPAKKLSAQKTILFVGRLNRYKGVDRLIQALIPIKKQLNIRLIIVGRDDGELANLQKLTKDLKLTDYITFSGALYNQEVIKTYAQADLFAITPTHAEETPLAGVMALACGCPVLTNKNAYIPWLDEYKAGVTIARDNDLSSTLLNLLQNDKILKQMSQAAKKLALTHYSWKKRVKEFEKLII